MTRREFNFSATLAFAFGEFQTALRIVWRCSYAQVVFVWSAKGDQPFEHWFPEMIAKAEGSR